MRRCWTLSFSLFSCGGFLCWKGKCLSKMAAESTRLLLSAWVFVCSPFPWTLISFVPRTWVIILPWTHVHLQLLLFTSLPPLQAHKHTDKRRRKHAHTCLRCLGILFFNLLWLCLAGTAWVTALGLSGYPWLQPRGLCAGGPGPVSSLWILKPEMDGREQPLPCAVCAARLSRSPPPSKQILLSAEARRATFVAESSFRFLGNLITL